MNHSVARLLLSIFMSFLFSAPSFGRIIHVDVDSRLPVTNGRSWMTAYRSVQQGLDAARYGDEMWVAAGTYSECIILKDGVRMYGGFAGNETKLVRRPAFPRPSPDICETILDGAKNGSVVTTPEGATSGMVIDGFTIQNGKSTYGAGLLCQCSSMLISRVKVVNNISTWVGGGIYTAWGSSPTVTESEIADNTADLWGGGIACGDMTMVTRSTIVGNVSNGDGGGIHCQGTARIIGNMIIGNTVSPPTWRSAGYGGGICNVGHAEVTNNTVVGNHSRYGGGMSCGEGTYASPIVANNIFAFNSSGVYVILEGAIIKNNCIYGNADYDCTNPDILNQDSNISVDPQLADWRTGHNHIQPRSLCVDAGNDSYGTALTDIDGQDRVLGSHVDIGADESDGSSWTIIPSILRVSTAGDDKNDGSSWQSAKRTVQAAIDTVSRQGGEVWVAKGLYNERITLRRFVEIYGGFDGTELERSARDAEPSPTILDGQQLGTVISISRLGFLPIVIDGFSIRNGVDKEWRGGGGIGIIFSHGYIQNNRISDSRSVWGGGVFAYHSYGLISGNTMLGNSGGGVHVGSGMVVSRNIISASIGSGIYCYGNAVIRQNTITGNKDSFGGGIRSEGDLDGVPIIDGNVVSGNTGGSAGGIYCHNGKIINNIILNNTSSETKGGMYLWGPFVSAYNNTVVGNTGGILCDGTPADIVNNIVAFNSSGITNSPYWSQNPVLRNNCVFGNTKYDYKGIGPGTNDISVDPLFMGSGDFRLRVDSPCIDRGSDSIPLDHDIFGNYRPVDGNLDGVAMTDIGAHEYSPSE